MARYAFSEFMAACAAKKAQLSRGARQSASHDFSLATEADVLAFIVNGGLEKPVHENTALWENNPDPNNPIDIDSYEFCSGEKRGYIAFLFQPKTKMWLIKSFKLNSSSPLTFSPFGGLAELAKKRDS